jgi:dipeptidase E
MQLLLTSAGLTNATLQEHFFSLVKTPTPTVAFIATAAEIEADASWVEDERRSLKDKGITLTEVNLSRVDILAVAQACEQSQAIWVNGGNTYYLMHWVRTSGFDKLLSDLLQQKPYIGVSAGSMVMGQHLGITEEFFPSEKAEFERYFKSDVSDALGLGLVPFSILPHYLSVNPYFSQLKLAPGIEAKASRHEYPILALSDDQAILVDDQGYRLVGQGEYAWLNAEEKFAD